MLLVKRPRLLVGQHSANRDDDDARLHVLWSQASTALCGGTIRHVWPYIPVSCVGNPDRRWCPACAAKLGVLVVSPPEPEAEE